MKSYLYTLIGLLFGITYSQAQTWHSLGSGLNGPVYDIAIEGADVYVGGNFTNAGGKEDADYLARWDGEEWHAVAPGLNNTVYAIVVNGVELYVGGEFTTPYSYVARAYDGKWYTLENIFGPVKALALDQYGLYAAGPFDGKLAIFDGQEWAIWWGGLNGEVNAIITHEDDVYLGGSFTFNGTHMRVGHLKNYEWQNIEQPEEISNVYDLVLHDDHLYLAGEPLTLCEGGMGGVHEPILRWDGSEYSRFEQRLGGCRKVTTLGIMDNFLLVDATDVLLEEDVFKWNLSTQRWDGFVTYFPEGPDYIKVFASDGANLYMGGTFTNFEGAAGDYIVRLENPISSTDKNFNNSAAQLKVFPNPVEHTIQFDLEDCHSGSHLIIITDAAGSTVLKKQTEACTVDISSLEAGIYFLKVENGVSSGIGKIIKQ